jgi:hypothetical protein
MKNLFRLFAVLTSAALLSACGGGGNEPLSGGGGTGGGGAGTPSLSLSLQDASGNPLTTPALTGTQNVVAVLRLRDGNGTGVPNTLVAVSGTGLTLNPASGQTITDSTGTAKVQLRSSDPFASGATTISASGTVEKTVVSAKLDVALGAASAQLGALTASASSVPAYQTVQVSVPATLSTGGAPAVQYPITFSASCGQFDPPTATTDASGIARTAYRNQSGSLACSGTQTLTATAGSTTVTTTVTAVAPAAANIVFVGATPTRIYLAGSPGVSQSLLQFKLVDSNNNPVQGENLILTLTLRPTGVYLGSTQGTTTIEQPTNSDGTVEVAVNAGSQPGPVQIQATLKSNPAIKNVSNSLAIASGLPVQRAFSMSVETFNIEGWEFDGITTEITLRIADRLGNPVPDGTTVNFITEGSQIVASCNTTGAEANDISGCSVTLSSQNPRPANGRITVLAWAQGEEDFVDDGTPTNNVYDGGEAFSNLGQPFLDKDENGIYDAGLDVTVGVASGAQACPVDSQSVPNTCDSGWGSALVRNSVVIVLSGQSPDVTNIVGPTALSGDRCRVTFTLSDARSNPLPAGTTLAVENVAGGGVLNTTTNTYAAATLVGFTGEGNAVPNTAIAGGTNHGVVFSGCPNPATLSFGLKVTTPKGKATTLFLP